MRNCRQCDNDFLPWDNPVSNVEFDSICCSSDVEMHSEAQCFGVGGLQDRQAKQLVDVEPHLSFTVPVNAIL